MIYAFSDEGRSILSEHLRSRPLLAFDIDGTLAPIVAHPDDARLPDELQGGLASLAQNAPVAIVTGRALSDALRMLAFAPRYVVGNHGAEGVPGWEGRTSAYATVVRRWREQLAASPSLQQAGVIVEDKRYSLSLHFRNVADPAAALIQIRRDVDAMDPAAHVIPGKMVVNLMPAGAPGKGDALRALLEHAQRDSAIYVGDDDTDETVFGMGLPGVLAIRVEPHADSAARLYLQDQGEMAALIRMMNAQVAAHRTPGADPR